MRQPMNQSISRSMPRTMSRSVIKVHPYVRWAIRYRLVGLLLLGLLAHARPALAHGLDRVLQQRAVALGNCEVTIWTGPGYLRPGEIHVMALVVDAEKRPVWANLIQVLVEPIEQMEQRATGVIRMHAQPVSAVDRLGMTHEAAFRLDTPGRYRVTVQMVEPSGQSYATAFPIQIRSVSWWVKSAIYLLFVGALAIGIWLLRLSKEVFTSGSF